jgi:hypothetical protein
MFHILRNAAATIAAVGLCTVALAQQAQFGTKAEAKAMEMRVIAELKANESAAVAKFNKADGGFRDRDLYVYCFNTATGIFTAQVNPALMGTDNRLLKEKDGSPLGQKVYDAAQKLKDGQITTVSYNYPRPHTDNPVPKVAYVSRVGNTACGVGYYK